jgi:hypothetical protein
MPKPFNLIAIGATLAVACLSATLAGCASGPLADGAAGTLAAGTYRLSCPAMADLRAREQCEHSYAPQAQMKISQDASGNWLIDTGDTAPTLMDMTEKSPEGYRCRASSRTTGENAWMICEVPRNKDIGLGQPGSPAQSRTGLILMMWGGLFDLVKVE